MIDEITTTDCAGRLLAVASHLADHPELAPVDVSASGALHVIAHGRRDRGPALLAWARSLDADTRVEVRSAFDAAHVEIHSELDAHAVRLFCTVPGLAYVMGEDAFRFTANRIDLGSVAWISLDEFADFVEHGTAPVPIETLNNTA